MKTEGKKNPILVGSVSGGVAALIVMTLFFQVAPSVIGSSAPIQAAPESGKAISETFGPDTHEGLVISAVKKATPSVVSVIISKDVPVMEKYYDNSTDPFGGSADPFGGAFGGQSPFSFQMPQYRQKGTEKKDVGGGSGFIVSADGYIVTNKHVVSDPKAEYTVFIGAGTTKYTAKVVATDPLNDIAVLKIEASGLPYLQFGDSDKIEVGQTAIAIGNPLLEFTNSVSVGVISGLSRSITAGGGMGGQTELLDGVLQTDAAINPGNSGGPLLNLRGEVVGVNVAVASAQSIGFALPSNLVKNAVDSVKATGKISRAYLGLRYVQINKQIKDANKLDVDNGALVLRGQTAADLAVIPGSPADKAGIVENDIVLEIDGQKLDDKTSLSRLIAKKQIGDTVKLKVLSKGKEKTVEVKLEELKQ